MNLATYKRIVQSQFDASLDMLEACIASCPARAWKGKVAKYEFWHVAYHTLYCTDLYTATTQDAWSPHPTFHPGGASDVEDEYPSRLMTKKELLAYLAHVRTKVRSSLRRETAATMRKPAGFPWLAFRREELPIYNLRHVQHHTGQLSAFLRRHKVNVRWVKAGAV
ncbi:MAG: DinB family protein [Phycisphaerae bacterium]|nr:DinB family protein [Phycisphaerae bacterium]